MFLFSTGFLIGFFVLFCFIFFIGVATAVATWLGLLFSLSVWGLIDLPCVCVCVWKSLRNKEIRFEQTSDAFANRGAWE